MDYYEFLTTKFKFSSNNGFDITQKDINPKLKPHQKDIVQWAVKKGRAAVFCSFGLGKTWIQTEILKHINNQTGGKHLIIAPLGVRQEFKRDGKILDVNYSFVKKNHEVTTDGFYITNYESVRDNKIDVNQFTAVSLDEASILRGYGNKTYQSFLLLFDQVPYKFVATATPSPNRYKELIHYAGFLGIMDTGQALTRFFQRDSKKANNLTLYPHMEQEFYHWLHSWAMFLQTPSNLGYSDEGYSLPELKVIEHELPAEVISKDFDRWGQGKLIKDVTRSLSETSKEKRESIGDRVAKAAEIINNDPDNHYIIWHDLEDERHAIKKAIPDAKAIYGSQDSEKREQDIIDFQDGKFKYLAAKPSIAGSGCNFQRHCHKAIFMGVGYKFNDFIQAIHRIHRFLQTNQVEIHIIYTENEREVLKALKKKWADDKNLRVKMSEIIRKFGLVETGLATELKRDIGVERKEVKGKYWTAVHNDCVDEIKNYVDSDSVDLIHTSIPFGNHYEYSANYNDFGHNSDNVEFFKQMDYLTPELLRVLKPGRVYACHVKDRIQFGNVTGYGMPSVDPFHVDCINHYRQHGFIYFGMITVVTDVVRENNQTYRLGWSEQCKDGSKMGVGSPEYILLFRKLPTDTSTAYADEPVKKDKKEYTRGRWQIDAHAFWRSSGDRFMNAEDFEGLNVEAISKLFTTKSLENIYSYKDHVQVAETLDEKGTLPSSFMSVAPASHRDDCWHDVHRMNTLNAQQGLKREANHVCPLQIDIVERIIERYTNKGELVLDPFGGLMTVPYCAVKMGRKGYASELNKDYHRCGVSYLKGAEREVDTPTLFDALAV